MAGVSLLIPVWQRQDYHGGRGVRRPASDTPVTQSGKSVRTRLMGQSFE
jgi:hypothetical protein